MVRLDDNTQDAQTPGRTAKGHVLVRLAIVALAIAALPAHAEKCSDYPGGVVDGALGTPPPVQLRIDRDCTIRNYPATRPFTSDIRPHGPARGSNFLAVFDEVVHTGGVDCDAADGYRIWFANSSSAAIESDCSAVLEQVGKIDKQNPGGGSAAVGVPFTYTMNFPLLYDPAAGTVVDAGGARDEITAAVITDDLNDAGADLSYVSHRIYWVGSESPVPHSFTDTAGELRFADLPVIPAGRQIAVELTVVLDDTPRNATGTSFSNTARAHFSRLVYNVPRDELPAQLGSTAPMTIAGPDLLVSKSGPATINLGENGAFTLDVVNTGTSDAWHPTLLDRLPDGASGGMCDRAPVLTGARVYMADGVTPVPGRPALAEGLDYDIEFAPAPVCEFTLRMHSAASTIAPGQRLVVSYDARLDDDTRIGVPLTNVAGAVEWFNGDGVDGGRLTYTRALSDGTPGAGDHEDAHTLTSALSGIFYEKTVANLSSGASPAETAAPGDMLRYTLRVRTTDSPLSGAALRDELGALNPTAVFESGTLALVAGTVPPGADSSGTDPSGGKDGAGIVDITGIDVPADSEVAVQFDIRVAAGVADSTVVTNQAQLYDTVKLADSDDPNVNGAASPAIDGDEDPTSLVIETAPPSGLTKTALTEEVTIGGDVLYRITVPAAPHSAPLYDVLITDNLLPSAADLEFVDVTRIAGSGDWTPVNSGSPTQLRIRDPDTGIDIPAGEQVELELRLRLLDTPTNRRGLRFSNTVAYSYNLIDDEPSSRLPGGSARSGETTIVEPRLRLTKSGAETMQVGVPGAFTIEVSNPGSSPAYRTTITDLIPNTAPGGMCETEPTVLSAQVFAADGATPVSPPLAEGTDFLTTFDVGPLCAYTFEMLTDTTAIGVGERLIVRYEAVLDPDTEIDAAFTNVAGASSWSGLPATAPDEEARLYRRSVTNGTPSVRDHQDAHTVVVVGPKLVFEKTVANLTSGRDPATEAAPGDQLRYRLRVANVGDVALDDFRIVDELDRPNSVPSFRAGTLALVTTPAGADTSATDPAGGAAGTGLIEIGNLQLEPGESVLIEFDIGLASGLADDSIVANQSTLHHDAREIAASDDPHTDGAADPKVRGDEDVTAVRIVAAPEIEVHKVSADLDGDPAVLLPGERLRYTISVRNVGAGDLAGVRLVDAVPAYTSYVAGSATLNGAPVADAGDGRMPLIDGLDINAAADPTPGVLRANPEHVATIAFDIIVDEDAAEGTVISNQAFISAADHGIADQPSDDPRTELENDPTRDVVGDAPLLFAVKTAALQNDGSSPGIVDPGDTLRYTITVHNDGRAAATEVRLTDALPANTVYVPGSLTLNGVAVSDPPDGSFALAAGLPLSSADLTPPLPAAGDGTISAGESATVSFDLRVADGVASGTLITNQALVDSARSAGLLTDADGNPDTGPEPTVVVVGDSQQVTIVKEVVVLSGGAAWSGEMLEYAVTVRNIGSVPARAVVITDDLDSAGAGRLLYVEDSARLNGVTKGVTVTGTVIRADYGGARGALAPGASATLRFRAVIAADLPGGTTLTNTAVAAWDDPPRNDEASVSVDVGAVPGAALLLGRVWHDEDHDDAAGATERPLAGWTVELLSGEHSLRSVATDTDGRFSMAGVPSNGAKTRAYALRFSAPGADERTARLGTTASEFSDGLQRIDDIRVAEGRIARELNLPVDPNGVIYDAVARTPVAGAKLTMIDVRNGKALPPACFDDPNHQDQVTLANGYYKFALNLSDPACPSGINYLIQVAPPGPAYLSGASELIPPDTDAAGMTFDVPACLGGPADAVPDTPDYCEAQASGDAPDASVAAGAGTRYLPFFRAGNKRLPGSAQLFNNHIPLDPRLDGVVSISKTTPKINVSRGQMVPYTISFRNTFGEELTELSVVDRFPAGFRYVAGSARLDGVETEPVLAGRELTWPDLSIGVDEERTIKLLLAVGAGVTDGEFVNRAQVMSTATGSALSNEAQATVRIVPDPNFDCTDVTGKVYDDVNRNGYPDRGEAGVAGVRIVSMTGLAATTDAHGRYHITCAITPHDGRGSNLLLKLDDRTLPTGFRTSTRPVQVQRATRGKALRVNFGASIHHVVGLDIADAVFEPGTTDMRTQWLPRIDTLVQELQKRPSVLRLSYVADVEPEALVRRRLETLKKMIAAEWRTLGRDDELVIEPEIFWRRGAPPGKPKKVRR